LVKSFIFKLIRPLYRRLLRSPDRGDAWERVPFHPRPEWLGMGSRQQFDWYMRGESSVSVKSVQDVIQWLLGCEYVSDDELFGEADHWQHPTTFERLRRGDCEDHALWAWRKLLELHIDADFVVGRLLYDDPDVPATKGGHAWVVFRDGGTPFLLEAVSTSATRMVRPLAEAAAEYRPEFGVDRTLRPFAFAGRAETLYEHEFKQRKPQSSEPAPANER
jgi:hypothetical protein